MTTPGQTTPRFMKLPQVAEILATTDAQVYALVRSGQLPAIKIGGRGQWRVETDALEGWILDRYAETRQFIAEHPMQPGEAESLTES